MTNLSVLQIILRLSVTHFDHKFLPNKQINSEGEV